MSLFRAYFEDNSQLIFSTTIHPTQSDKAGLLVNKKLNLNLLLPHTHLSTTRKIGTTTTTYPEHYCMVQILSTNKTSPYQTL